MRPDLLIVSVTLPQFRLRWLDDSKRKSQAHSCCMNSCMLSNSWTQNLSLMISTSHPVRLSDDDFFSLAIETYENTDATAEVDMYLTDTSRDIECLVKFPGILKLFKKYNTPLPSSAPVERLFSLGGQILIPRRNRMTDAHFERQSLLRANKLFVRINKKVEIVLIELTVVCDEMTIICYFVVLLSFWYCVLCEISILQSLMLFSVVQ